jgi:hypothetical protein
MQSIRHSKKQQLPNPDTFRGLAKEWLWLLMLTLVMTCSRVVWLEFERSDFQLLMIIKFGQEMKNIRNQVKDSNSKFWRDFLRENDVPGWQQYFFKEETISHVRGGMSSELDYVNRLADYFETFFEKEQEVVKRLMDDPRYRALLEEDYVTLRKKLNAIPANEPFSFDFPDYPEIGSVASFWKAATWAAAWSWLAYLSLWIPRLTIRSVKTLLTGSACSESDVTEFEKAKKRAEAGDVIAQNSVGVMYNDGIGVLKDNVEAAKWFRKAADQGDAAAQGNLGVMYAAGCGVPKDEAEAYAWLNLSAVSYFPAKEHRDLLQLTPEEKARAQQRSTELFSEIEARKKAAEK